MLDYVSYPGFTCRVAAERNLQQLAKLNGSQRHVGLIFPGDAMRQVFLGTLVLGDESGRACNMARTKPATSPAMSSGSAPTAGAWSCRSPISNPSST